MRRAEEAGALRHLADSVVFLGYDLAGSVRSATKRFVGIPPASDGASLQKRDIQNSDKSYPCHLPGDGLRVGVVESGISGLAFQTKAEISGLRPPSVIVTGGVNVRSWVSNECSRARALILKAEFLTILGENERDHAGNPDPVKQEKTDAMRTKLLEILKAERPSRTTLLSYPPAEYKDAADWLAGLSVTLRQRNTHVSTLEAIEES